MKIFAWNYIVLSASNKMDFHTIDDLKLLHYLILIYRQRPAAAMKSTAGSVIFSLTVRIVL